MILVCWPALRNTAAEQTTAPAICVLQLGEDVVLRSNIVRVQDILTPVGQPPAGWDRVASSAVGLLPADGRRLRVERQRVRESLQRCGLLGESVRIVGPEYVAVRFVAAAPVSTALHLGSAQQAKYEGSEGGVVTDSASRHTVARPIDASLPPLLPAESNRIERMLQSAFAQSHSEVLERYEMSLINPEVSLPALSGMRAIRNLRLTAAPHAGQNELEVQATTETGLLTGSVTLELVELPMAVVSVGTLNRGDVIGARDLEARPISRNQFRDDYLSDPAGLVGLEVVRTIASGRPVRRDDVTEPILIRRGDLIELRVVGAGIVITTNAKALGSAAAGELIVVETDSPRRRITARAARLGVAEILTRPPTAETTSNGQ